jgi:Uma2 family endonuclease
VKVKSRVYALHGVPSYWIADPELDRLELFRLEGESYALAAQVESPDVARPAEFPGLEIRLDVVFAR